MKVTRNLINEAEINYKLLLAEYEEVHRQHKKEPRRKLFSKLKKMESKITKYNLAISTWNRQN